MEGFENWDKEKWKIGKVIWRTESQIAQCGAKLSKVESYIVMWYSRYGFATHQIYEFMSNEWFGNQTTE